ENYEKIIKLELPNNNNIGYGYRNKALKYSVSMDTNKKISIDLDNDGKEDSLSFEIMENNRSRYSKMYVNKGEENEAVYNFDDEYLYSYNNRIIDIDKTDNYKEIVLEQDKDNWIYTILRYDGKNIEKICDYQGIIEIDEDGNCIGYNPLDTESVYVNPDGKYLILDENTEGDYRDLTDKELKFVFEDQYGNYWYTEKKDYMKDIINDAIKEKK
nr:hypothetical protein [Lachnospiraceae bacterium]